MTQRNSRLKGFFKLSPSQRLKAVATFAGVDMSSLDSFTEPEGFALSLANSMSENVVGKFGLPLGFATNFRVNGHDYLIPMVIEEPSVVAAASFAARLLRGDEGQSGIHAEATEPIMIGQLHFPNPPQRAQLEHIVATKQDELARILNRPDSRLIQCGGGFRSARVRWLTKPDGSELAVVHLLIDVRDAMGANAVNSMAEAAAPYFESWTGCEIGLRILSNLPIHRRAKAHGTVLLSDDGKMLGERPTMAKDEAERIVEASYFAESDPYRAVTANKGIMNGIDALLLATGQDFRAVEAAAHAFAAYEGHYTALAKWRIEGEHLVGTMDIPLALGTVGGITAVHPVVKTNFAILGIEDARTFAQVVAAVGLAQNLAATRALASEGIQRGHMRLHARNFAVQAGARDEQIADVVAAMIANNTVSVEGAKDILAQMND